MTNLPKIIDNIETTVKKTENAIVKEIENRKLNNQTLKEVNDIKPFLQQQHEFVVDFQPLDVLTIDGINRCFYKQWQVQVYENSEPTELEFVLGKILANITYNIIYTEETENVLDYYNAGSELRQMGFFSVEGNIIYFNVSVFIQQTFFTSANINDYLAIVNPQAKLEISIQPFYNVKR